MATLRLMDVWPSTGFPDRPWLEHPDEDAFARSARSVCELYSESVRRAGVPARHSELRFACHHDGGREDVLVTVHPEIREGSELAVALLPDGIAGLPAQARGRLVLNVLHAAAMRLGRERGWDEAVLVAARAHVLAADLRYRWEGPSRTSPDRRHTAHPMYVLHDDGYGRVVVRVRRQDGEVVAASAPALAFSTSAGFARSARTLRWRSKTVVELVPYAGLTAGVGSAVLWSDDHGLVTLDLDEPWPAGRPIEPSPDLTTAVPDGPRVVVRTPAEAAPHIEVLGGGPVNNVPDTYLTALNNLLAQLDAPEWQTWWSAGSDQVLEIWYDFAATKAGLSIRRGSGTLRTTIRRPASTFTTAEDAAGLAHEDVRAMLAAVRRRTGLGTHPPLS